MFCVHCGKEINNDCTFCEFCGTNVKTNNNVPPNSDFTDNNYGNNYNNYNNNNRDPNFNGYNSNNNNSYNNNGYNNNYYPSRDEPSALYAILCFFFPVVGLILYLVWKEQYPFRAHSCGKGALISVIVYAILIVLYIILIVVFVSSYGGYSSY